MNFFITLALVYHLSLYWASNTGDRQLEEQVGLLAADRHVAHLVHGTMALLS